MAIREYLLSRFIPRKKRKRKKKLEDEDEKTVGEGNEKGGKKMWEAGIRRVSLLRRTKRGRREEATQLRNLSSVANNEYRRRTEYFEEDFDGDLRLLPLHPPIHPPSSKEKTKISEGGEGSISGERKEKGRRGKRREHGTCSSSVPRDAFFYASHFLRFQKRKKKKKNSTQNERLLRRTNQGFFQLKEGGGREGTVHTWGKREEGGGKLRRSSKNINRAARWGCRGRPEMASLVSRGEGCGFRTRESFGIVANTHRKYTRYRNTRVARVRTFEESFVSDWQRFRFHRRPSLVNIGFCIKNRNESVNPTNEFEPSSL